MEEADTHGVDDDDDDSFTLMSANDPVTCALQQTTAPRAPSPSDGGFPGKHARLDGTNGGLPPALQASAASSVAACMLCCVWR